MLLQYTVLICIGGLVEAGPKNGVDLMNNPRVIDIDCKS